MSSYKLKSEHLAEVAYPVISQVFENQGAMYENILIPITDGKRMYNISCNLKEAYESHCKSIIKEFQKSILLHTIDDAWKEHLRDLDQLRQSVQNASYEQKDPLLVYKLESYALFKNMIDSINRKTVSVLMRGQLPVREPEEVKESTVEEHQDYSQMKTEKDKVTGTAADGSQQIEKEKPQPVQAGPHIGRNDLCPCGSGKKYKNCHGQK